MKKDTAIILLVVAIVVVCLAVVVYLAVGAPSTAGWTDNASLSDAFLEEEDVGVGCEWKIMSDGTTAGMTKVRLYSRVVYPGAIWELQREGLVDSEGNFYWHTYY